MQNPNCLLSQIHHFVTTEPAATFLREAIESSTELTGTVFSLLDNLSIGPLQKTEEGQSFAEMRQNWWHSLSPDQKPPAIFPDMVNVLAVSKELYADPEAVVWFWMEPTLQNACAYGWLQRYMKPHAGRFLLLNIAGLPFLDANGKLFTPTTLAELPPREWIKARKLARPETTAEFEMDGDDWQAVSQHSGLRLKEGKKLEAKPADWYDNTLRDYVQGNTMRVSRILSGVKKDGLELPSQFIIWRLQTLAEKGILKISGDGPKLEVSLQYKDVGSE